jgi:hypothetical protein
MALDSSDIALALTIATLQEDNEKVTQLIELMSVSINNSSAKWIFNLARKTTKSQWLDRRLHLDAR